MDWRREVDEDEIQRLEEKTQEIPQGWRPSRETIEAIQSTKDTPREEEWVDRGIQDVPVNQVDLSDSSVENPDDFSKVSHSEMVEGFIKLQRVVRPSVEQGADGDYFSRMDQEQGLDYQHGYQRVYDAFYGDSAIRLGKVDDNYDVTNGYHRLAVARELGFKTVPARVIEKVRR